MLEIILNALTVFLNKIKQKFLKGEQNKMIAEVNGQKVYAETVYTKEQLLALKEERDAAAELLQAQVNALNVQLGSAQEALNEAQKDSAWIDAALAEFPVEAETMDETGAVADGNGETKSVY